MNLHSSIVLLLAFIFLATIVTAESDFSLWHATDCTGKVAGKLHVIIIVAKTCFACAHC